jgi:hypothetical protein
VPALRHRDEAKPWAEQICSRRCSKDNHTNLTENKNANQRHEDKMRIKNEIQIKNKVPVVLVALAVGCGVEAEQLDAQAHEEIAQSLVGNSFGSAVASFDGTLDLANIDGSGHYIVGVSDVTGDGHADLVSAHTNGNTYVWPGSATGSFGAGVPSFSGTLDLANIDGSGHYIVGVSDVVGDGRADLISTHTNGNAYVWPGGVDGSFGAAVSSFNGTLDLANIDGFGHYIVGISDVTGDGRADLVSAHTNGNVYVWPGRADARFGAGVASFNGTLDLANLDGSGHYIVSVSDVGGDGRADLVSAHTNGNAYVWPGLANAGFGTGVSSFNGTLDLANLDGSGHYIVGVSDVGGDGRADLVSAHTNGSAYVWPGDTNGSLGAAVPSFSGTLDLANIDESGQFIVGVADVTGDDHADLVSAHTAGSAYVWPGQ